jgi:predicted RecB family nuclease
VPRPLRGDEISACVHRVALSRGAPEPVGPPPDSPEQARRRREADQHRRATLARLGQSHAAAVVARGEEATREALDAGRELVLSPSPLYDRDGERVAVVQALVRVGRNDSGFAYAPLLVKNAEVVEAAATRRILRGDLARPWPSEAAYAEGLGTRGSPSVVRAGLALAHATRVLESRGLADPLRRGALVDRHGTLYWVELDGDAYPRFSLSTYDRLAEERHGVIEAHRRWSAGEASFPTSPYWHRQCPECPYVTLCESHLEAGDDVSLTRFTSFDQQVLLREHGIATRAALAALDPARARAARNRVLRPEGESRPEDHLGRAIDKLDELIFRARAHVAGSPLRVRAREETGCERADVEVDVDMESYHDRTYLWGALVTTGRDVDGVDAGFRSFVEWDDLDEASEARVFRDFWRWFSQVEAATRSAGASFAAYCFWAQAEDSAMNRAVGRPLEGGPTRADLDAFRARARWVDLHEVARRQIQTEGPAGLKVLASAAGFNWRDPTPSGEASMTWFEEARGPAGSPEARRRLLEYNEDDCRATRALREWLNGPARDLASRDEPGAPPRPR